MMYALAQPGRKEPFTYKGRVLLHHNLVELEWLFPNGEFIPFMGNTRAEVQERTGIPAMLLRDHPDMAPVKWPLNKEDFL